MTVKLDPNISRHNIPKPKPGENLGHLASGYDDSGGATAETYTIPPCGIEDCDRAITELFKNTIKFSIATFGSGEQALYFKKPQVIFAIGERFAVSKKLRPPRNKKQVLLLPAISVRRSSIEQTSDDITSRGMNQFTGDLIIKRRLAPEDKDYQTLLNKYAFRNIPDVPHTTGESGGLRDATSVRDGILLEPHLGNNIFEIFAIPQPQFFTATYEIAFWTSHQQHMNYMLETFMSSFLPQSRAFRLGTDKGYWFMAYTDENYASRDNFEDLSSEERIVQYSFTMRVKGFVLATNGPANPVPIRRYLSAPKFDFEILETTTTDILSPRDFTVPVLENKNDSSFILSDINQSPETIAQQPLEKKLSYQKVVINPITGKKTIKYVKQAHKNKSGETSYYISDVKTLEEFLIRDDE